jgi:hypothetical protein
MGSTGRAGSPSRPSQGRDAILGGQLGNLPSRLACGAKPLAFLPTFVFHGRDGLCAVRLIFNSNKRKKWTTRRPSLPKMKKFLVARVAEVQHVALFPWSATHWHLTMESILVEDALKFFRVPGLGERNG